MKVHAINVNFSELETRATAQAIAEDFHADQYRSKLFQKRAKMRKQSASAWTTVLEPLSSEIISFITSTEIFQTTKRRI